ncbi:CLUMA_CG000245, isoform A [Clunio marinus]|uniref:CLUMA_CG000245, isoform A n=1 Tax=Clunio marinus TaxID=568069 RepID=A0A1J1HJ20_9DIPT|nr:CLUMA_CG000245, isoform A [Clunio marinus]
MVITNVPHLDIGDWLKRLELLDYEVNFQKFFGVEDLIELSESDIKDLGIKNSAHRARIVSSLVALKVDLMPYGLKQVFFVAYYCYTLSLTYDVEKKL